MRFWAALTLVLTCPSAIQAAPPEMKPIAEFLQKNTGSTNASSEVFVGLRCLSLFMVLGEYSAAGQMPDVAKNLRSKSMVAFEFVKNQPPYKEEFVKGQVKMMVDLYTQRVRESKARTGSFSDDDVIKADIAICGEIF